MEMKPKVLVLEEGGERNAKREEREGMYISKDEQQTIIRIQRSTDEAKVSCTAL